MMKCTLSEQLLVDKTKDERASLLETEETECFQGWTATLLDAMPGWMNEV